MNSSTQGHSLCFERCCKGTLQSPRAAGQGQEMLRMPLGSPGLLMVPSWQTQVPVASTVWMLGMVQDLQDMEMCSETPCAESTEAPKGTCRSCISGFKQEAVCP